MRSFRGSGLHPVSNRSKAATVITQKGGSVRAPTAISKILKGGAHGRPLSAGDIDTGFAREPKESEAINMIENWFVAVLRRRVGFKPTGLSRRLQQSFLSHIHASFSCSGRCGAAYPLQFSLKAKKFSSFLHNPLATRGIQGAHVAFSHVASFL